MGATLQALDLSPAQGGYAEFTLAEEACTRS
jgi:hypothetical protein